MSAFDVIRGESLGPRPFAQHIFVNNTLFISRFKKGPFPSRFMNHVIDIYSAANEFMRNQNIQLLQVVVNA